MLKNFKTFVNIKGSQLINKNKQDMKKISGLVALIALVMLVSCGGGSSTGTATTDSTKVDSLKVVVDSAIVLTDSIKADSVTGK